MKLLRIGIVGCGKIAEQHARHIIGAKSARLIAAVEPNPERLEEFAARYGIERRFSSLEALIGSRSVDVVHICTPPKEHFAQAELAIEAGLHVFIEKPVTMSARNTAALLDLASKRGVKICPNFIQLFLPSVERLTRELEAGRFGKLRSCWCEYSADLHISALKESVTPNWCLMLEGGILQNFITHPLYLILRWIGPARRIVVAPQSTGQLPQDLADHLDILLEGSSGTGHLLISMATRPPYQNLTVFCERGSVAINISRMTMLAERVGSMPGIVGRAFGAFGQARSLAGQNLSNLWSIARKKIIPYQGMRAILADFYESIVTGGKVPVPAELVLAVSEAEEAIVSQLGKTQYECRVTTRPGTSPAVVVTGASGYVGQEVVKRLTAGGYHVRALVRPYCNTAPLEALGAELVWGDIRDYEAVARAFQGARAVAHLAAGLRGGARYISESCTGGTENIARAARECGLERVVYVSSVSVYDLASAREGSVIAEDAQLETDPEERGPSSAAKRAAEDIALREASAFGWTILRPGMIFGNGRAPLAVVGGIRMGRLFVSLGLPGKQTRLIHVSDVAEAIARVLENEPSRGKVFNLAHPDHLTVGQAVKIYRSENPSEHLLTFYIPYAAAALIRYGLLAGRTAVKKLPAVNRKRMVYFFRGVVIDSRHLQETLGWVPPVPLSQQFRETCRPERTPQPGKWFWASASELEEDRDTEAAITIA